MHFSENFAPLFTQGQYATEKIRIVMFNQLTAVYLFEEYCEHKNKIASDYSLKVIITLICLKFCFSFL